MGFVICNGKDKRDIASKNKCGISLLTFAEGYIQD